MTVNTSSTLEEHATFRPEVHIFQQILAFVLTALQWGKLELIHIFIFERDTTLKRSSIVDSDSLVSLPVPVLLNLLRQAHRVGKLSAWSGSRRPACDPPRVCRLSSLFRDNVKQLLENCTSAGVPTPMPSWQDSQLIPTGQRL